MANILEPMKNLYGCKPKLYKIQKLLTNSLHRGPLKTTLRAACGPRVEKPWPTSLPTFAGWLCGFNVQLRSRDIVGWPHILRLFQWCPYWSMQNMTLWP